jgi:spore coat protein U-like protein
MTHRIMLLVLTAAMALPATCRASSCGVSATGIAFGGYNIFDTVPRDSTGNITVQCQGVQPNRPVTVTVSISTGSSGSYAVRQMVSSTGSDRLNYNVYTNSARTIVWGNGTGGSSTLSATLDRTTPWTTSIHGRIPPRQNVSVGSYSDALTVTISM